MQLIPNDELVKEPDVVFEYDFDTPNLMLAEAVMNVAEDCDDRRFTIRFDFDITIDLSSILRSAIKHEFPDIGDTELNLYIERYRQEQEKEKAARRAEKERLTNAIKEKINGQAQAGWELAYKLCCGLEDDESKKLRYRLLERIPDLSLQERIEICEQYLEVIRNDSKETIHSDIYLTLADLSSQAKQASLILLKEPAYYLNLSFALNEDQISSSETIVDFCIQHNLEEELKYWIKKYENICLKSKNTLRFSKKLRSILYSLHHAGLVNKTIMLIDANHLTEEMVDDLARWHEYDTAVYVYDQIANIQVQNNQTSGSALARLVWLNAVKYRKTNALIHYYDSNWTAIYVYDYCYANDPIVSKEIDLLKLKYSDVFMVHRHCLEFIDFYHCQSSSEKQVIHQRLIDTYEKEISIIPQIIDFLKKYGLLLKNRVDKYAYSSESIYNIPVINLTSICEYANCTVYKQLSIYYEKTTCYDDALRVCESGISIGYLDDETKMGMIGRKQRILKRKSRAALEKSSSAHNTK